MTDDLIKRSKMLFVLTSLSIMFLSGTTQSVAADQVNNKKSDASFSVHIDKIIVAHHKDKISMPSDDEGVAPVDIPNYGQEIYYYSSDKQNSDIWSAFLPRTNARKRSLLELFVVSIIILLIVWRQNHKAEKEICYEN